MSKEEQTTIQDRGTDTVSPVVARAIQDFKEVTTLNEETTKNAAIKEQETRYINGTELLHIATMASEVIDIELQRLRAKGVKENPDSMERIVAALAKAKTARFGR